MLEKIAKILRDYKDDDTLEITETTTFADLELDSLDTVELIMSIEEEFDVNVEMSENIKSISDLMAIISAS